MTTPNKVYSHDELTTALQKAFSLLDERITNGTDTNDNPLPCEYSTSKRGRVQPRSPIER